MWQDELVTRGLDIGMTTIAAVLAWGARSLLARKEGRVERMAGVLEETHIPTDAVTVRGVLRRLFDWR